MNIIKENKDALNAVIKINIEKADYENKIEEVLRDYKKKANIKGFRPGMVPTGMIKKMYGKQVLYEEINKLVSDTLYKYITDEKLDVLGDPLPNLDENTPIDLDNQEEFTFIFDLALSPVINLNLTPKNKFTYYNIIIDDKIIKEQIDRFTSRFSNVNQVEVCTDKEMIKGDLIQLDESGNIKENGIKVENATISVNVIRDEEIKNKFAGLKKNDTVVFDVYKAFPNETEVSSLLKISKEAVAEIKTEFQYNIHEISEFIPCEVNQELFDKVYGEKVVTSEEEFKEKIKLEIADYFTTETEYKFLIDAKENLLKDTDLELPEEFLKRWLKATNQNLTDEQLENDFPIFTRDLKWQLIVNKIVKENELKVEESELIERAKQNMIRQFKQYGINTVPEEYLENYSKELLKKDDEKRKIYEKLFEDKAVEYIKTKVTLDFMEISSEDFDKLFTAK